MNQATLTNTETGNSYTILMSIKEKNIMQGDANNVQKNFPIAALNTRNGSPKCTNTF